MQQLMFYEDFVNFISIDEAAASAKVSSATIRNWIKAKHLKIEKKGFIVRESLETFLSGREGSKKLTGRANKSQKDSHDHEILSSEFIKQLDGVDLDFFALSEKYQAGLSESFRNKEGIYYTPNNIVVDLLSSITAEISDQTFLDPCCGSGNFIIRALELGFKPENVYGYDTDPIAVEFTKKRIFQKTGYKSAKIKNADFLEDSIVNQMRLMDYIYTNPPWGKKLEKDKRNRIGRALNAENSVDTCSLFFFACLRCLAISGRLGLLLPESFFNIATFESARIRALSLHITDLIDYDRPFKGLLTKSFAMVLKNESVDEIPTSVICRTKSQSYMRWPSSFAKNPKSIINFQTNPDAASVIEHVFSVPHVTLSGKARWGLGIVTGNNDKFMRLSGAEGHIAVFRGTDISKQGLTPATRYIPSDLTQYQQVAPIDLYKADVKLIYKFISSRLCFYCDTEQRYILNSVNMLVPSKDFPITPRQLCALLNSELINWLFFSLFKTCKILRADLEVIPIHIDFFQVNSEFTEDSYLDFLSLERIGCGAFRVKNKNH